ncbi:flagellar biosynthesis anti-sigma factor FlgM [Salinibius halmophilus]|uniref:flagellar biosynthesis anti-sigma factor FlgM n=1 Tax=Salinibius halmophilus TaxID=1853216 RepID=UPI001314C6CB|nr:flagellar biosynthesis anti-sigma factor FlgM [Salinibius halmophilus]
MVNISNNNGMSKPVGTLNEKGSAQDLQNQAANKNQPSTQASNNARSADRVELSSQVRSLKQLEESVKNLPEVDSEKVASIKAAIESGDYQIDYDRLASAISKFESDL